MGEVRAESVQTLADLAELLRQLRRRHAREQGDTPLTYRELAAKTGWAHGIIGDYFAGKTLPPTDRFDILIALLGATPAEQGALATARDRVEENRRRPRPAQSRAVIPHELPSDVSAFTGRNAELAELDRLRENTTITVVSGTAGVGKTALAVRWAHRVADHFPDGCLYVDLRGYSSDQPLRPEHALTGCLRSLGLTGDELPPPGPELAARYRSLLAGRRVLVLLDNARSAEQVRPLLPGTTSCFVLITSRDRLPGLVARDGANRLALDLLPPADAISLLHNLIGPRSAAEPEVTTTLAALCAHLPLALRVAAELAASRSSTLGELVDDLADARKRLDLLDAGGDQATAVRGILSWSYRQLTDGAALVFRLLGVHPGRDVDLATAGALAGMGLNATRRCLAELAGAHLIEPSRPERHGMHDLLRGYAASLVDEDSRRAALTRLLDYYLAGVDRAVSALYGGTAAAGSLSWLDTELPNLVAAVEQAPEYAGRMSEVLWRYLDGGGHVTEALTLHRLALSRGDRAEQGAALSRLGLVNVRLARYDDALDHLDRALAISRELRDAEGEKVARNALAHVHSRLGHHQEALEHLGAALAIERRTENRAGEAKVLGNLGIVHAQLCHYAVAAAHFEEALRLAKAAGDPGRESETLNNLGLVNIWLGHYPDAAAQLTRGLSIARDAGNRPGEGRLHANLGIVHMRQSRIRDATASLARALEIHRETGDRAAEAETLTYRADLLLVTGRHRAALADYERALAGAREIGERSVQASALNGLGRCLLAAGEPEPARTRHESAQSLARAIGDRLQHAKALDGIADCLRTIGESRRARAHWQRALAIYQELGVPEADELRDRLGRAESRLNGGAANRDSALSG